MKNGDCTTTYAFWLYSKDFLEAALKVSKAPKLKIDELNLKPSFPAYFLLGHSIELSLKAFLLGRGISIDKLRAIEFGHNLESLLKEARKRKLGREVQLSKHDCTLIRFLNQTYMYKGFEYHDPGSCKRIPTYLDLVKTSTTLVNGLLPYCYGHASGIKVNNPAWIREHSVSS